MQPSFRVRTFRLILILALVVFALIAAKPPQAAQATASRTLEATYTSVSNGWVRVERWKDNGAMFTAESYFSDGRNNQTGQRSTFFASSQPHSSKFLLYYAPGWNTGSKPVPVLLVHGANDNADRAWAAPNSGSNCGASSCPSTGLMQHLSGQGYKVFAINFPHMHGNNYHWAEQIHDAVEIIKSRTGASQVDVVSWSKGAFASRQYASSVYKSGGSAYGGSIRKLILLGGPNKGIDYTFRHGILPSIAVYPACGISANAPAAHTDLMCFGVWYSSSSYYVTSNYFPGQAQMLYRWDGTYSLNTSAQDWYTTYYGGWGFTSYSPGIVNAMSGRSLVATIRANGIPASIKTYLYCGGANDIPSILNEFTGPSDGVVFKLSCGDTGGIGQVSGNVANNNINHLELAWNSTAMSQISTWLSAP